MDIAIQIPDVCERDIDLLLLEEFVSSVEFRSWFFSQIGVEKRASLSNASRSVHTVNGETDLDLTLQGSLGVIKVLIENKVDAAFQPDQPQRYAERANEYRKSGKYSQVITVVIAPNIYFGKESSNYGFDFKVTYESILSWFKDYSNMGVRKEYKLIMIRKAIDRGRVGWKLIPDQNVSQFWKSYWKLSEKIAPQLSMPLPKDDIPADSHFIRFRPSVLPQNISLWHKVGFGHVDLQFANMGDKLYKLEKKYQNVLLPMMRIEKAAKSAVIRCRTTPVQMTTVVFSDCEPVIRKGIETAAHLLDWYKKMHTRIR